MINISLNDIIEDIKLVLQKDDILLTQLNQFKKNLKTKFVSGYLDDLRKGSKPELGALRDAFFSKHGTFLKFLIGEDYEITSEVRRFRKYPDTFIVKEDFSIKIELELKKLFVLDATNKKIVKKSLNPDSFKDEIRDYLESSPFVILTNLEVFHLYTYKSFIKTGEIIPIKSYSFEEFVRNIQDLGFIEFILRESVERREELGEEFFTDLSMWLNHLETNVELKGEFKDKTQEIFIQLLNKLIFVQTLDDLALIDFNFLKKSWNLWDYMYGKRDKKKVVRNFLNSMITEFSYTFYDTELFLYTIEDKIVDSDENYDNFYDCVKEIIGIRDRNRGYQDFSGLISYPFIFIDEDIFGKSYEKYLAEKKKEEGIYYTPTDIRKKIIIENIEMGYFKIKDEILEKLALPNFNGEDFNAIKILLEKMISIKILDPACGSGSFLVTALGKVWEAYKEIVEKSIVLKKKIVEQFKTNYIQLGNNPKFNACNEIEQFLVIKQRDRISIIILRHLYGKDLDKNALNIAKVNIWLKALKLAPNEFKKSELEKDIKNEHILPNLETNLIRGNSLIGLSHDLLFSYFEKKSNIFEKTIFDEGFIKEKITETHIPDNIKVELNTIIDEYKSKSEIVIKDIIQISIFLRNLYIKNVHHPEIIFILLFLKKELTAFYDREFYKYLQEQDIKQNIFKELKVSHWYLEFCHAFFEGDSSGFDFIVGNPPYVFAKYKEIDVNEKKYYNIEYYSEYKVKGTKDLKRQSGKNNLFCFFLVKSIKLLKKDGVLGFILPNTLLRATTNDIDRKLILDQCKILKIIDLGAGIFEKVTSSTILFFLQRERMMKNRNINIIKIEGLRGFLNTIQQDKFLKNTSYVYCIYLTPSLENIFTKIEELSDKLIIFSKYHIAGIDGSQDLINYEQNINLTDATKNWKPLLLGRDIGRFEKKYQNRYISYIPEKLNRARTGIKKDPKNPKKIRHSIIFEVPKKIISQRISGGKEVIIAYLDEEKHYTFNSVNNFIKKKFFTYDYYYYLALFNSYLVNCFYRINYTNNSTLTVNLSRTFLDHLPIYRVNFQDINDKNLYNTLIKYSKEITKKKKIRTEMLLLFDKLIESNNQTKERFFGMYYNPKNVAVMKLCCMDHVNSQEFNKTSEVIIKEYKVELLDRDFLLIFYREKDSFDFKPLLKLKFTDNNVKEYFFFSLKKDTINLKNYRSPKKVFDTFLKDLNIRFNESKDIKGNVATMKNIITTLKSKFAVNLTHLNAEILKLEEEIDEIINTLYKLSSSEIDTLKLA